MTRGRTQHVFDVFGAGTSEQPSSSMPSGGGADPGAGRSQQRAGIIERRTPALGSQTVAISDEKYVCTTTYRKSGDPVSTPTWIVDLNGGRVGFLTSSKSGKYKRLRNNPRITLQPSDPRGKVKAATTPAAGTATLTSAAPDFDAIQRKIRAKYGFLVPISRLVQSLQHIGKSYPHADVAVLVTLDQG